MWDKKIIVISGGKCVKIDFLKQVGKLAKSGMDAFVLREKDLSEFEHYDLAKEVSAICAKYKTTCFSHFLDGECLKLEHRYFHMPLALLRQEPETSKYFHMIGTSVHSREELLEAMNYGVNYAFVDHIFESSCKKDLESRGLEFLNSLLSFSQIPFYAMGGINVQNIASFKDIDVAGVCMREVLMREKDVKKYLVECKRSLFW